MMLRWVMLKRAIYLVRRARRKREAALRATEAAERACRALLPFAANDNRHRAGAGALPTSALSSVPYLIGNP